MSTTNERFSVKKMDGTKVKAFENGKLIGYYQPSGWGCWDNVRNEFIIISDDRPYSIYTRKSTMVEVVRQFNVYGATCGNDNLQLIQRY